MENAENTKEKFSRAVKCSIVSNRLWAYVTAAGMIFLGTTIEYFIIARLSRREGYKGFPATVIPFICVAAWYGVLYFLVKEYFAVI